LVDAQGQLAGQQNYDQQTQRWSISVFRAGSLHEGVSDTVVPFEQSQMMLDAMKGSKKAVELVTLKKEDHWLSRGETRLEMLETSVAFLRAHNPPD
jgi:hypothetical protein